MPKLSCGVGADRAAGWSWPFSPRISFQAGGLVGKPRSGWLGRCGGCGLLLADVLVTSSGHRSACCCARMCAVDCVYLWQDKLSGKCSAKATLFEPPTVLLGLVLSAAVDGLPALGRGKAMLGGDGRDASRRLAATGRFVPSA